MLNVLSNPEIQAFIKAHEADDVAALALKKPPAADWPYARILEQIKARQKAAQKIPLWQEREGVVFPPADIIEQASSAATARYKAQLVQGEHVIDLTAGAGVDSCAFTEHFNHVTSVEQSGDLATTLAHNAPLLSDKRWDVVHQTAETFIRGAPHADLIYIDPQRRKESRKGLYRFSDCSPDITALLPALKACAPKVIIKASPMLDITKGAQELEAVSAVHVVEWQGQCKEVLYVLDFEKSVEASQIAITAVSLDDEGVAVASFSFTPAQEETAKITYGPPQRYLYEPGPAFLKSGGYKILAAHCGMAKLHPHTHLYTSEACVPDFPGRGFEIIAKYPAQAKKIPLSQANLTVRNFPQKAPDLQKKLKLKDGGDDFLFACTLQNPSEEKVILHGRKI